MAGHLADWGGANFPSGGDSGNSGFVVGMGIGGLVGAGICIWGAYELIAGNVSNEHGAETIVIAACVIFGIASLCGLAVGSYSLAKNCGTFFSNRASSINADEETSLIRPLHLPEA